VAVIARLGDFASVVEYHQELTQLIRLVCDTLSRADRLTVSFLASLADLKDDVDPDRCVLQRTVIRFRGLNGSR
jgi:hypothetical protein